MTRGKRKDERGWAAKRRRYQSLLPMPCARCGLVINPWDDWELDHLEPLAIHGPGGTVRPSHSKCNRAAGNEMLKEFIDIGRRVKAGEARANSPAEYAPPPN